MSKILLCGRKLGISGFENIMHSFLVIDDGESTTVYTGRSELSTKTAQIQQLLEKLKINLIKSKKESLRLKRFLSSSRWGKLVKYKNWSEDTLIKSNEIIVICDSNLDSSEQVKNAIFKIENAFLNYKNTAKYKPVPFGCKVFSEYASEEKSWNSNSFAYSLLCAANLENKAKFNNVLNYPGWGLRVPDL